MMLGVSAVSLASIELIAPIISSLNFVYFDSTVFQGRIDIILVQGIVYE